METKKAIQQLKEIKKFRGDMRLAAENWASDFQTLISTILSARTLDETTIRVSNELFSKYPDAKSLSKAKIPENRENNQSNKLLQKQVKKFKQLCKNAFKRISRRSSKRL